MYQKLFIETVQDYVTKQSQKTISLISQNICEANFTDSKFQSHGLKPNIFGESTLDQDSTKTNLRLLVKIGPEAALTDENIEKEVQNYNSLDQEYQNLNNIRLYLVRCISHLTSKLSQLESIHLGQASEIRSKSTNIQYNENKMGGPTFIQNSMFSSQAQVAKNMNETMGQRFKALSARPVQKSTEVDLEEIKNLIGIQNNIKIPTNNLMKNLLNQKTQNLDEIQPLQIPVATQGYPKVNHIFKGPGMPPQGLVPYIQQHMAHMQASSTLLSSKSQKLIENMLNPLVKSYVQDLKDQNFWGRVGRMQILQKIQAIEKPKEEDCSFLESQGQGKQEDVEMKAEEIEVAVPQEEEAPPKQADPEPKSVKIPQKFDIVSHSQAENFRNQSFAHITLDESSQFMGNLEVHRLMLGSPKPPGTVVINLNDDFSEKSSKVAILQKIIKVDDLVDPYTLYGNDTESEDPKPPCRAPKQFEMRKTRRQSLLQQQPKTQYFIRGKAPITGFELMQLNKKNEPQCLNKIGDEKEWNFSGRPITQVIHDRKQVSKEIAKKKSRSKERTVEIVPVKANPGTIQKVSEPVVRRPRRDKNIPLQYTDQDKINLPYKCKFCPIRFRICSALGGHISKAHPGQSKAYNHKKTVRESRELERTLHKQAMDQYVLTEKNNNILLQIKNDDMSNVNRNTIKRIKKDLVLKDDKYVHLRKKFMRGCPPDDPDFCGEVTEILSSKKLDEDSEQFDIMKQISQEMKNDPMSILNNLTRGKSSPATSQILKDQGFKSSKEMLDEALSSKAPKMKQIKKEQPQEQEEQQPEDPADSEADTLNLKEILDSQPELLQKFMQKNDIDEGLKSQLLKHIGASTPQQQNPLYSGIHIKRGQIVGLENIFGSYGREDKDLESFLNDLQSKVSKKDNA